MIIYIRIYVTKSNVLWTSQVLLLIHLLDEEEFEDEDEEKDEEEGEDRIEGRSWWRRKKVEEKREKGSISIIWNKIQFELSWVESPEKRNKIKFKKWNKIK